MPSVLTTASTVTCGHVQPAPGAMTITSPAKLTVSGSPVLLGASVLAAGVPDCGTTPSAGLKKCTKVSTVTAGAATKLTVGGAPVMLDTLAITTDGNPAAVPPAATANQTKLQAL